VSAAVFLLFWLIAAAMMVNAGRLHIQSVVSYRVLRANERTPLGEPRQPRLRLGISYLRNPPSRREMGVLDQIDLDGWMAAVRSTLWALAGIATGLLGVGFAERGSEPERISGSKSTSKLRGRPALLS
jgi:hypothetical protein